MKVKDLISSSTIKMNLDAKEKDDAIRELTELLDANGKLRTKESYLKDVFAREEMFPTGIGFGLAIPHGKSDGVREPAIAFGKSASGIDFGASDGTLAYLIFLLAVPLEEFGKMHLEILSQLSKLLMHESFREKLRAAKYAADVVEVLSLAEVH